MLGNKASSKPNPGRVKVQSPSSSGAAEKIESYKENFSWNLQPPSPTSALGQL